MEKRLLFGIMLILSCSFVFSSPAAPSPVCEIDAKVLGVEGRKLNVSVSSLNTAEDMGEMSCKKLYGNKSTLEIKSREASVSSSLQPGVEFTGTIQFRGDEFGHGVYLDDYNITSKVKGDSEERVSDDTGNEVANGKKESFFSRIWSWLTNLF